MQWPVPPSAAGWHLDPGAQSVMEVQPTVQAPLAQAWGAQVTEAPATQAPVASQVEAPTAIALCPAVQVPGPQVVPTATGAQVPALPLRLQAWQVPQAALEQQTPSVHSPLWHSRLVLQAAPSAFKVASTQTPSRQTPPVAQSPLAAHTVRQLWLIGLHTSGRHDLVMATPHFPAPSHVRASVAVLDPAGHEGAAHCVPDAYT